MSTLALGGNGFPKILETSEEGFAMNPK